MSRDPPRGRGTSSNLQGRFERWTREAEPEEQEETTALPTRVEPETAKSILTRNDSPDISFSQSINPYRGCEHGCIYCYARPSHAYLGLSPGLDFETRLFAKHNAAELLKAELGRSGYRCSVLALGSNTDPYQPVERERRITRDVLGVLAECRHPLIIVTKSSLVERDLDLLVPMAERRLVRVYFSITTLDAELARRLEPRAASPRRRLQAMATLSRAGVPTGVLVSPVIPVLTDPELEAILHAAGDAGAAYAGYAWLRLPNEVNPLFKEWLQTHYPLALEHVLSRVRALRGGRENDSEFGRRLRGEGVYADLLEQRFAIACRRLGLNVRDEDDLDTTRFRAPRAGGQMELF